MPSEVITSIRLKDSAGPIELRLERTRVLRVASGPGHHHTEAIPLDMVDTVAYGERPRNILWGALGLLGLIVLMTTGILLLRVSLLAMFGTVGLGFLVLAVGIFATLRSEGHHLLVRSGRIDWRIAYAPEQAPKVASFLDRLMMVRLAYLEGVYGEEDEEEAGTPPPAPEEPSALPAPTASGGPVPSDSEEE